MCFLCAKSLTIPRVFFEKFMSDLKFVCFFMHPTQPMPCRHTEISIYSFNLAYTLIIGYSIGRIDVKICIYL